MKRNKKNIFFIAILVFVITCSVVFDINKTIATLSPNNKLPIFRVNTEEKQVALTFDINWAENEYLYEILDVLKANDVKATFFIMGGWVNYTEENKEKLIKINEDGHEIGNHSYIHPNFTNISQDRIQDELNKTEKIISETIGKNTKLFRFPSGAYDAKSLEYINSLGYKCIQWDVDSVDWKQSGEDIEYDRVMKKVKPGSIMLFHNNAKYTPKNLQKIINSLKENGYKFRTVGQLIYDENYNIDENGEQHKNNY